MKLLEIQSSPRGESSDSITLTQSFIEACKSHDTSIVVDTLNVWHERLPEFDYEAIGAKYKAMKHETMTEEESNVWERIQLLIRRCPACEHDSIIGHERRRKQAHDEHHDWIGIRRGRCLLESEDDEQYCDFFEKHAGPVSQHQILGWPHVIQNEMELGVAFLCILALLVDVLRRFPHRPRANATISHFANHWALPIWVYSWL